MASNRRPTVKDGLSQVLNFTEEVAIVSMNNNYAKNMAILYAIEQENTDLEGKITKDKKDYFKVLGKIKGVKPELAQGLHNMAYPVPVIPMTLDDSNVIAKNKKRLDEIKQVLVDARSEMDKFKRTIGTGGRIGDFLKLYESVNPVLRYLLKKKHKNKLLLFFHIESYTQRNVQERAVWTPKVQDTNQPLEKQNEYTQKPYKTATETNKSFPRNKRNGQNKTIETEFVLPETGYQDIHSQCRERIENAEIKASIAESRNMELVTKYKALQQEHGELQYQFQQIQQQENTRERKSMQAREDTSKASQIKRKEYEMKCDQVEKLQRENEHLSQSAQFLRNKVQELTTSLAQEMSNKMTADETSIENVSIQNRPINIAEDFYNFCSNAWLDAKNTLDDKYRGGEVEAFRFLDTILKVCEEQAKWLLQSFNKELVTFFGQPKLLGLKDTGDMRGSMELPVEVSNVIGDYMRRSSKTANLEHLQQGIVKNLKLDQTIGRMNDMFEEEYIQQYINEAAVITWNMAIQRPPMIFTWEGQRKPWDERTQEPYWKCDPYKAGSVVTYYIHPSLHHGDSLMVKGKVFID